MSSIKLNKIAADRLAANETSGVFGGNNKPICDNCPCTKPTGSETYYVYYSATEAITAGLLWYALEKDNIPY